MSACARAGSCFPAAMCAAIRMASTQPSAASRLSARQHSPCREAHTENQSLLACSFQESMILDQRRQNILALSPGRLCLLREGRHCSRDKQVGQSTNCIQQMLLTTALQQCMPCYYIGQRPAYQPRSRGQLAGCAGTPRRHARLAS